MNDNQEVDIDRISYEEASQHFDPATFSTDSFVQATPSEWGDTAIFTPQGLPYIGSEIRKHEG